MSRQAGLCYRWSRVTSVVRWYGVGVAALVMLGCSTESAYTCSDASMCIVGQVGGICQATGYCSFPDGTCDSGQRYGEFAGAGLADECVPPGAAETDTNESASSTTGNTSTTTLGTTTSDTTTTASDVTTTTMEPGPVSGTGDESTSTTAVDPTTVSTTTTAGSETGSESSTGEPEFPTPPCADYNFEDAFGAGATLPSVSMFEDQFSTSCYPGDHIDVVFYWVAPEDATYEFSAEVDLSDGIDVAGSLWTSCEGMELACDDDGGGGLDTVIIRDVSAGEEFLYVVTANGDLSEGFQMSISQK